MPSIATDNVIFSGGTVEEVVLTRGGDAGERTVSERTIASENGEVVLPLTVEVIKGIHRSEGPATRAAITTDPNAITKLDAWCIYTKYTDATQSAISTRELYFDDMTNPDEGAPFEKAADGIFYPAEGYGPYLWRGLEPASMFNFYNVSPAGSGFDANIHMLTNTVTFDYTVPASAADQKDILVASPAPVATNYNQPVPLTFKHVMAAVNVKVGTVPSGTITSVKFTGVYDKGSYFPDSEEWTNRSISTGETDAKGVFEVALPAGGVAVGAGSNGTSLTTAETSFMMIPQQLASGAEIVVGFTDAETGKEHILRASIQGDIWEMNTTTNYWISIDPDYNVSIVPIDKVLDSHYIITRVEVSSEYPTWQVTAVANDGAEVTVQLEEEVNPMAKQGFWTDKRASKDGNGNYYIAQGAESARGTASCGGNSAVEGQVIYVFIPENISGETRTITLNLTGISAQGGYATKTLQLTQDSVKWMRDPKDSDSYWGCEILLEGGQVPWGFSWDEYMEFDLAQGGTTKPSGGNIAPGRVKDFKATMQLTGIDPNQLFDKNNYIQIHEAANMNGNQNATWFICVDLSKLGNIVIAPDIINGYQNTYDIYHWNGISYLNSVLTFLVNWDGVVNPDGSDVTEEDVGLFQNTLDYAAMYAMKRNRFHLYEEVIDGTTMRIPVIEDKDLNWYLPAKDQFPYFMDLNWGQSFSFNDVFWTSTAHIKTSSDDPDIAHSYAYLNGIEARSHREEKYFTFALRRYSVTGSVEIPINPGDVIQPGGDIEVNPPGGDDNTGGDIVKP